MTIQDLVILQSKLKSLADDLYAFSQRNGQPDNAGIKLYHTVVVNLLDVWETCQSQTPDLIPCQSDLFCRLTQSALTELEKFLKPGLRLSEIKAKYGLQRKVTEIMTFIEDKAKDKNTLVDSKEPAADSKAMLPASLRTSQLMNLSFLGLQQNRNKEMIAEEKKLQEQQKTGLEGGLGVFVPL
jgi:hypothetical protein